MYCLVEFAMTTHHSSSATVNLLTLTKEEQTMNLSLLIARKLAAVYWRRLVRLGVPVDDAMYIAIAIAKFDVTNKQPRTKYRNLIGRYCSHICRAELWRPGLLV